MSRDRKLVSRGTVLVDPRAAVAKLRGYQLGEPVMYVLELVRAAVAGGATAIDLENDADDFALTFDGDPIDADDLARLLDFLLSESHRRHRLIAVAVNTALGFSPRYVDLYTTRFEGAPADGSLVARVRWSPRAQSAEGVDLGVISKVPRPVGLPAAGMRVHVREAFGLAVLREWFRASPAETDLLRDRVVALPVPLTRNGVALSPRDPRPPLASVALELTGDLRGALELLEVGHPGCDALVFCERGVALEVTSLRAPRPGVGAAPLRMIVDGDALPTNAARSKVTLSAGLRGATRRAWESGVMALLDAAVALAQGGDERAVAVCESLAALVRFETGDPWTAWSPTGASHDEAVGAMPVGAVAKLLDAPIVPLASGSLLSLRALLALRPRYLWTASKPPPAEISPWLRGVVWVRDERPCLLRLLAPLEMEPASAAIARAKEAQSRHTRFMALPPGEVSVEAREAALRVPISVPGRCRGELVVTARGLLRPGVMRVVPWIERRPLGAETTDTAQVSCEVAFEAPGLRARPEFDGAVRDAVFEEALTHARDALFDGLSALVAHWQGALSSDDPRDAWIGTWAEDVDTYVRARVVRAAWSERLSRVEASKRRAVADEVRAKHPWLDAAPAWPTTDEARTLSTAEARALASKSPAALLTAPPSWTGAHPAGAPVLALDGDDRATLAHLLPERVAWVDYKPFLTRAAPRPLVELLNDPSLASSLPWVFREAKGARIAIAPSGQSGRGALTLVHAGQVLDTRAHTATTTREGRTTPLGHALIVLEDDALYPSPKGNGAIPGSMSREAQRLLDTAGETLARALSASLRGERGAPRIPDDDKARAATLRFLLLALKATEGAAEHEALGDAITAAPIVPVFNVHDVVERVSINAITDRYALGKGPLPSLPTAPAAVDGRGFEPIILPPDLAAALSAATGVPLVDASSQLPYRKGERSRRLAREGLASRAKAALEALASIGAAGVTAVTAIDNTGTIAIAPAASSSATRVQVLFSEVVAIERAEVRTAYPIVARVALAHERLLRSSFDNLTTAGVQGVERLLEAGAMALAAKLADEAHRGDVGDAARSFLATWMGLKGRRGLLEDPTLREALLRAPLWRAPSGERVALEGLPSPLACVRVAPGEWLAPAKGEAPDPVYLCVADESWVRSFATLTTGAARDVTQSALTTQRARRLAARGTERVRLDGAAPSAALAGRIEALAPSLGFGELRLVDASPGVEVSVFVEGRHVHRTTLRAPFGAEVAVESAAIDPARVNESFLQLDPVPKLLAAARTLLERAATSTREAFPRWARPALRWWLLTTPGHGPDAHALTAFVDSAGRPMSLDDFDAQSRALDAVAFATDAPPGLTDPIEAGRRVVLVTADEARWLGERWSAHNYTATLFEDAAARRWEAEAPRAEIAVTDAPAGALRVAIREDGAEGEIALLPPTTDRERSTVRWFSGRRPLEEQGFDAPWPCVVAVESRDVVPNRKRSAPLEDDAYRRAREALSTRVSKALDAACPPPADALVSEWAHDRRSPGESRGGPRVAGSLWLSLDAREGVIHAICEGMSGAVGERNDARFATPVHGRLWVRRGALRDATERDATLAKVVEWAWQSLLESLVARARSDADFARDDRVVDHLVRGALRAMLTGPKVRQWARANTLPGTGVSYERVGASKRRALTLVDVGDPRVGDDDALPDIDTPWMTTLRAHDRLQRVAPEPPREEAPPETSAKAPTPSEPAARAWELGLAVSARLGSVGVATMPAVRVAPSNESVSARRPMVRYNANTRTVTVFRAHPTVVALEAGPSKRAACFLALAAFGAIRRAGAQVTDAHEASFSESMLRELAEG